jgi:N-hydroxyarylamine O-acetyltransferase
MTDNPIDLDTYFARIGYDGSPSAALETLQRLHACHATAIPFENIDPLMGEPVSLDLAAISHKFLLAQRGGYCYEHNTFFQAVLRSLGFRVSGLAAVVQWRRSDYGPRIHMVLRVDLPEGPYIADVGFGGLTLTSPLKLEPGIEQTTTLEPGRLIQVGTEFQIQVLQKGAWEPIYLLSLQEASPDDYAVYNWFTSTNPDVVFTRRLMVARPGDGCRHGLMDNVLSIHQPGGDTTKVTLDSVSDLVDVLHDVFDLELPIGSKPRLHELMQSVWKR